MAIISSTLARIKSDPLAYLGGAEYINGLFAKAGYRVRACTWDPATTLGVFILQVLHGNAAISELRHLVDAGIRDSTYCDARMKLPVRAVAQVVEWLCRDCCRCTEPDRSWRGHRVFVADATSATTPDEPELQRLWPQPTSQKPGCGFPVIKLMGLLDLVTGMIVHLAMMCLNVGDMSQLQGLHGMLQAGDVLLADRGFCSFVHVALLLKSSVDAVFRMHQRQIVDFTPNRPRRRKGRKFKRGMPASQFVRRLGHDDQVVKWARPQKPQWMSEADYALLPQWMEVRELRYRIEERGRRTREVTLATTLLDSTRYPKHEIAKLYGLRWQIETNFRHLKVSMRMARLKCGTEDGVMKELMIFTLVYNLICAAVMMAAGRQGVDPRRISFLDTARWLRAQYTPPRRKQVIDMVVNPARDGRWNPRVIKRRMNPYDLMNKPRNQYTGEKHMVTQYRNTAGNHARRKTIVKRACTFAEALESRVLLSTYTVTTLTDPPPQFNVMTLRLAVTLADENPGPNTINFAPSLFSASRLKTLTLTQGELVLSNTTGPITIIGPGSSELAISGNSASRIFEVTSVASASIHGLTIENGRATQDTAADNNYEGGAIFNSGMLALDNDVLATNKAAGDNSTKDTTSTVVEGGAIFTAGTLSISQCTLTGNSAIGGVSSYNSATHVNLAGEPAIGGAVAGSSASSITVTGSTLTSNSATGGDDGKMGANASGSAQGGAISAQGKLTVTSSTLSGNVAMGGDYDVESGIGQGYAALALGGAIYASGLSISSSTLDDNRSVGGTTSTSSPGAGAGGQGGAIYVSASTTITSCVLSDNSASSGQSTLGNDERVFDPIQPAIGGAIASVAGTLKISQSTVSGNAAVGGGWANTPDAFTGPFSLTGLAGGNAYGGGIMSDATTTISGSSIFGNTATGGLAPTAPIDSVSPTGNGGAALGAGIYSAASITVTNSTVGNNTATGGQGGGASPIVNQPQPPNPASNGGNAQGGGIYTGSTFDLYDSTVSGNNTVAGPGGPGSDISPYPAQPAGSPGDSNGSGIFAVKTASLLDNTIVSANVYGHRPFKTPSGTIQVPLYSDIAGVNASSKSGYNFIGVGGGLTNGANGNKIGSDNPDLGALANNGGPTETMEPIAGSPVIDAGSNALIPSGVTTDQTGLPRIFNGTVDIGAVEFSTTVIGGAVFNDVNGDGVRQSSDPGLAKVQVFDDVKDVGYYVSGDPMATTNSEGDYSLTVALTPGHTSLIIRESRPTNQRRTEPAGIYPLGFYALTPTTATVKNITFGDSATALVTGSVFHDTNKDGKHEGGEADLGGWSVEVDQYVNKVWKDDVHSAVTNSDGVYSIVLAAGTYRLHDVLKSGLKPTVPSSGVIAVTLTMGDTVTGQKFGND